MSGYRLVDVSREARQRLELYAGLVAEENNRQNLVAKSTLASFASRHIDDSLQLIPLIFGDRILDIGSGAGLPGMVLACSIEASVVLVEPRRRRSDFLNRVIDELGLSHRVRVIAQRIEEVSDETPSTITARAVASLSALFAAASHLSNSQVRFVLPKGRSAAREVEDAQKTWQGNFTLVPSKTDPTAAIVVANGVRRRR